MKEENKETPPTKIFVVLLVISILLNLTSYIRIADLASQINRIQGNITSNTTSEINRIHHTIRGVKQDLTGLKEEIAWYSQPEVDIGDYSDDGTGVNLKVDWIFTEIEKGARVGFNYSVGDGAWKEAEIERVSGTSYSASFNLPLSSETPPVSISYSRLPQKQGRQQVVEQSMGFENFEKATESSTLRYVIFTEKDGMYRSGTPKSLLNVEQVRGHFSADIHEVEPEGTFMAKIVNNRLPDDLCPVESVKFIAVLDDERMEIPMNRKGSESGWTVETKIGEGLLTRSGFVINYRDGTSAETLLRIH